MSNNPKEVTPLHILAVRPRGHSEPREIDLRTVARIAAGPEDWCVTLHFIGGAFPMQCEATPGMHRRWAAVQEQRAVPEASQKYDPRADVGRALIQPDGPLQIRSWSPQTPADQLTEVHIVWPLKLAAIDVNVVYRLKSRGAALQVVDTILNHVNDVWPVKL